MDKRPHSDAATSSKKRKKSVTELLATSHTIEQQDQEWEKLKNDKADRASWYSSYVSTIRQDNANYKKRIEYIHDKVIREELSTIRETWRALELNHSEEMFKNIKFRHDKLHARPGYQKTIDAGQKPIDEMRQELENKLKEYGV